MGSKAFTRNAIAAAASFAPRVGTLVAALSLSKDRFRTLSDTSSKRRTVTRVKGKVSHWHLASWKAPGHTNAAGEAVALLRAYDKDTGEDVEGEVEMPAKQTGSPMSYIHNGRQYILVAVSQSGANAGAELIAYALP